jgi:hypothetical protein
VSFRCTNLSPPPRRRLEIQFAGESGFDASSGAQAGVTRGFYADVVGEMMNAGGGGDDEEEGEDGGNEGETKRKGQDMSCMESPCMWIADVDPSGSVIIPTPRASPTSLPGLFPRPIHPSYPCYSNVCRDFRLLGRLFASALRDGFLVPIPLSLEFVAMVQKGVGGGLEGGAGMEGGKEMSMSIASLSSNEPMEDVEGDDDMLLGSEDLPRPGFLGGHVAALEKFVVRELGLIDAGPGGAKEKEKKKEELAADVGFARKAGLGTYDCSFDDYVGGYVRQRAKRAKRSSNGAAAEAGYVKKDCLSVKARSFTQGCPSRGGCTRARTHMPPPN